MIELIASSLRLSTPLLFAAMGGILCERSGVATICLEGVMLISAFVAASINYTTGNPWLAVFLGVLSGSLIMCVHAFLSNSVRADQIVSGVVVNFLAAGMTPLFNSIWFGSPTNGPSIAITDRFQPLHIPLLSDIPILGPLFFQHLPLVYIALLLPFAVHYFLSRTGAGFRLIACGDAPESLKTAGISPKKVRYLALLVGGAMTSMGGIYLSISHASQFSRDMTAGRGFIALTALIFGKWKPLPTLLACLFFGLTEAAQIQLQSQSLFGANIPVQFLQALPYFISLVVLVGFIGNARPPISIGKPLEE